MRDEAFSSIKDLEEQLLAEPDSQFLREELLSAYVGAHLAHDPRRIAHVVEYVRRFPRTDIARCPFVDVDPVECPDGFAAVEREWMHHRTEHPMDTEIARGLALFLASSDSERPRAFLILQEPLEANPKDAELWADAGRVCTEPRERLRLYQQARRLDPSHENLPVWIAWAAMDARDFVEAEQIGRELLSLAAELRAVHGERLDWTDGDGKVWTRARIACKSRSKATELVFAISHNADLTHWGHTTLGIVAANRGDIVAAREHLCLSSKVVGGPRLSSYGPSFRLARELMQHGEWIAIGEYLRGVRTFWDSEDLDGWLVQIERREQPNFPDQ